ncbi:class I SAM-dependent methyltransferase [Nanoarchaeota archaeon]
MDEEFLEIKKAYKIHESDLLDKGKNLFWTTDKGMFGTSNMDTVFGFFKEIGLGKYKKFLDLGCGDGRIVLIASLFTDAVGIEYDKELVGKAQEMRDKLGMDCRFIAGDYMKHDIGQYDVVYINPDKGFLWGLDNKLSSDLSGDLFVYNEIFKPNALEKKEKHWNGEFPVVHYVNE